MFKRAQITFFIIFGIVLVLIFFLILNSSRNSTDDELIENVIYDFDYYFNVCVENSLKSAILESASKGFIDDEVLVHNEENYGFFIKDSNVFFKSKLEVEKTLSKLTNEKIKSCLDNFEQVSHSSHVVELNDINSTIFLYEESVFLEVSLNTSVTIEETSLLKKDFSLRLSYPLLRYYSLLDEFVEEQKYSDFFLISLLVEKLTQNNVNYIISYAGDNTIVVYLSLPDSVEEFNKELIMRFALK